MDFTNVQQSLMLLKAGIDPLSSNMVWHRDEDDDEWILVENTEHRVVYVYMDEKDNEKMVSIKEFPKTNFEEQQLFATTENILPAWSLGTLMNVIPDDRRQTVTITRGGYDYSQMPDADDDGYVSNAFFANFDYKDEQNKVFFSKIYGGDTYIEAVTKMMVDYLTNIKNLIVQ